MSQVLQFVEHKLTFLDAVLILPAVTFGTLFEDTSNAFPGSLSSTTDRRDKVQEKIQIQTGRAY